MNRIAQIVEFKSEEEMKKAREEYREYRKKSPVPLLAPGNLSPVPAQAGSQDPSEE